MPFIEKIATATPTYCHQQTDILNFMLALAPETEHRKLRMIYQKSGIKTRYSVIEDYSTKPEDYTFYSDTTDLEPFPSIERRMEIFRYEALQLSLKAIGDVDLTGLTHLITVSCTGMSAPGLDIDLVKALHLPTDIVRTSINFMGCYAGFHALRIADAFCKQHKNTRVLIVDVELCTLHFQKTPTEDNFVANAIFADGAAALIVSNEAQKAMFELQQFYSELALEGEQAMAWQIAPTGFLMKLSAYVPDLLAKNINFFVENTLKNTGLQPSDICTWAIHPGGRRILEQLQKKLEISNANIQSSYNVLEKYGNMSSATIFFVLENLQIKPKEPVFACGFGPGLTMESLLLVKV